MLAPLDTLPAGVPEKTLGWGVLRWALTRFIQPDGPNAGKPFRPTQRQVRFLLHWYALDDQGEFIYRHGVRRLAKGSGKSPSAAFMAVCELLGPVRFDYWDDSVPGGAVGKSVAMPLVQIAATAEHQTANTNRYVREFLGKGSKLAVEYNLDPGKTVTYTPGGGELRVITSSSTGQEGGQPNCVVADETEHWHPNNGGVDLFETLDRNLAKSSSRMIETCNAWEPGAGSVAEATWDAFQAQEEGKLRGRTRILYDCIEAPADVELADEEGLLAALAIVYSDCPWVRPRTLAERIWSPNTRPSVARRFYLNQRVSDETSWTTPTDWAALADPAHVVPDKAAIVAFFDGSKSGDATALIGCEVTTGHVFTLGVWEPADGAEVDTAAVDRAVSLMFDTYDVVAFFADVREWESYVKQDWPDRYKDRLTLWAAPSSTPPHAIAWDMRSRAVPFAQAAELVEQEIRQRAFTHDGDSRVARHVGNAQRRVYQKWITVAKDSPSSPRKIDAAVCVIGARMVRAQVLGSKEWEKRARRADRSVLVLR